MATKEKTQTIQDVLDSSSGEQRDVMDIVVGAALANESLSDNPEIISKYDALSIEQKEIINFVVGSKLSGMSQLKHQMDVEEFLSHFGVKGMRWGIRNDDKGSGKSSASSQKSSGHRTINAVLGDKTFWKRTAAIAGITATGIVASQFVPAILPASAVVSVGKLVLNGEYGMDVAQALTTVSGTIPTVEQVGEVVITAAVANVAVVTGAAAQLGNYATNVGRAIVGSHKTGTTRVNETLDKKMKHSELSSISMNEAEEYISHWGIKGMRWGVRRSDSELARLRGGLDEAGDAARARQTQTAISKAKSLAAVSDADLNHLVNRLNLEKRYVDVKASTSVSAKTSSKIKTLLAAGETMNKAVSFYDSEAGQILAAKLGFVGPPTGKHSPGKHYKKG